MIKTEMGKNSPANNTPPVRVSRRTIGGTVYIIESMQSQTAKESAYAKVKRLILNNTDNLPKVI